MNAEQQEPTGLALANYLDRGNSAHAVLATCPTCGADLRVVGLPHLAYTFTTCTCDGESQPHLAEQLWHTRCLVEHGGDQVARSLLSVAAERLERSGPGSVPLRRSFAHDIRAWLDRTSAR